jgi:hypothetical protein
MPRERRREDGRLRGAAGRPHRSSRRLGARVRRLVLGPAPPTDPQAQPGPRLHVDGSPGRDGGTPGCGPPGDSRASAPTASRSRCGTGRSRSSPRGSCGQRIAPGFRSTSGPSTTAAMRKPIGGGSPRKACTRSCAFAQASRPPLPSSAAPPPERVQRLPRSGTIRQSPESRQGRGHRRARALAGLNVGQAHRRGRSVHVDAELSSIHPSQLAPNGLSQRGGTTGREPGHRSPTIRGPRSRCHLGGPGGRGR